MARSERLRKFVPIRINVVFELYNRDVIPINSYYNTAQVNSAESTFRSVRKKLSRGDTNITYCLMITHIYFMIVTALDVILLICLKCINI